MNLQNKFFIPFFRSSPTMTHSKTSGAIRSPAWVTERLEIELEIKKWCLERVGPEEFPFWQFSRNYIHTMDPSGTATVDIMMSDGIFIFKEEDRVAFKLTYGITDESYI